MDDLTRDVLIIIVAIMTGVGVLAAVGIHYTKRSCFEQWRESGMPVRWSLLGGCQVRIGERIWIPAYTYRNVPQ